MNVKPVDVLKREFEKIVDRKNPIMLNHRPTGDDTAWQDCYYCSPNSSQALTLKKRVLALEASQPVLFKELMPIVTDAIAKQIEIVTAKEAALEVRSAKKQAAQEKQAEQAEIKRNPYHKLDAKVAEILKKVAEPYRAAAVKMETTRLSALLEEVKRLSSGKCGSFDLSVLFPFKKGDHYHNQSVSFRRSEVQKFVTPVDGVWALKQDVEAVIARCAEQFASDMVMEFVQKTGSKLSGIVQKKQSGHLVTISGSSLHDHWMHFAFEDGSSFDVQSQVVWKTSVNGVFFHQFPTCFRNVVLSNGTRMALPSEAKMKERFI